MITLKSDFPINLFSLHSMEVVASAVFLWLSLLCALLRGGEPQDLSEHEFSCRKLR